MAYTYEDKLNFIARLYCPARLVADETGCSWEVILGQAAQETLWGEKCLVGTNNVFNIKADKSWTGPSKVCHVSETINHQTVWVDDRFRVYTSYEESLKDRVLFLKQNPRYRRLFEEGIKGDYEKEAWELQNAKYATDKYYAEKIITIIKGPTMRRAIARAQARGCATVLPVVEVQVLDGAKVPIAGTALQVKQGKRQAEAATDGSGRLVIRAAPKGGDVHLKIFDKGKEKWVPLEPIKLDSGTGKGSTVIAPTFTAQTSTREHEKTSPRTPSATSPKPTAGGTQPHLTGLVHPAKIKCKTYLVVKGDSLASIAASHGVRYQAIARANGIMSPYIIRPGQLLEIPDVQAALALQEKKQTSSAAKPEAQAGGMSLAALGQMLSEGGNYLHTVYSRNAQAHPQTDLMHGSRAPWMVNAQKEFEKGVKRRTGAGQHDPRILEYFKATNLDKGPASVDETAYCAAFANWCLGIAGFTGTGSAGALSFKNWGRSTRGNRPALGAVALIAFPGGGHHVTFVAGISNNGHMIATLGGNQGKAHEVSHSYCSKNLVIAYRYPANYADFDDDYVLHDVASDHAPMSTASTH